MPMREGKAPDPTNLCIRIIRGFKAVQAQACLFFLFSLSDTAKLPVTNIYITNYPNKLDKTRKKKKLQSSIYNVYVTKYAK